MEEFFGNQKLNNLFCFFSEDIKEIGHQTSQQRSSDKNGPAPDEKLVKTQYDAEVDQLRSIAEFLNGNEEEDSFDDEIMSEEEDEII
jgi:hypothetical protein